MTDQAKIDHYASDEFAEALNVISRTGVIMLQSGASSFRTKDTMDRFAALLGIEQFDAFVTPTKIIGIVNRPGENYTRAMRIPMLGVNMSRVSAIHTFSHHPPQQLMPSDLSKWLDSLEAEKPAYSPLAVIVAVGAACGSFAVILGGGPLEFVAAAVGAAGGQAVRMRLAARHVNPYLITAVCSTIASIVTYLIMLVIAAPAARSGLIASVLFLVPGVPLVTALLDLIHLDLISGVTRGVYASILLINIGVGMLLVLALTGFSIL